MSSNLEDLLVLVQGEVEEDVEQPMTAGMSRRHSTSVERPPVSQAASGKMALARRHSVDFLGHETRAACFTPELPPMVSRVMPIPSLASKITA